MPSDSLLTIHNFIELVNIKVIDRENWHNNTRGLLGTAVLTGTHNGSKTDEWVGSGFLGTKLTSYDLGQFAKGVPGIDSSNIPMNACVHCV